MSRHTKSHRFCEIAAAAVAEREIGLDSDQT